MKTKKQIKKWLDRYGIRNYTINDDLTVDVDGDVDLSYKNLKSIDVQFNKVNGDFYCSNNQLTSLLHCPSTVNGHFDCDNNQLTSLDELKYIKGDLYCDDNLQNTNGYKKYIMIKHLRK